MKPAKPIEALILTVRDQKVILDTDLAALYGVPTKRLNEAVKRNADRFPEDFCFQLTAKEWADLKSQFATSSLESPGSQSIAPNRSQFATSSYGGRRKLPFAFTEHGALMAANVLNSSEAVKMSLYLVRAFIQMREQIAANAQILKRLTEIDQKLLEHDEALGILWHKLKPLLNSPPAPPKPQIGFREDAPAYRVRKRARP